MSSRALLALICLGVVALAGVASSGAASLTPPVIHESFTALPCAGSENDRSTQQEEGCAEQRILKSDKRIDALDKTIFLALGDAPSRRDLIAGHKAWLGYRKAYCRSVSDVFRGGTEAAVLDAECLAEVNAQHVVELGRFAADVRRG